MIEYCLVAYTFLFMTFLTVAQIRFRRAMARIAK